MPSPALRCEIVPARLAELAERASRNVAVGNLEACRVLLSGPGTLGPELKSTDLAGFWVYLAGILAGALLAITMAFSLGDRGWPGWVGNRPRRAVH